MNNSLLKNIRFIAVTEGVSMTPFILARDGLFIKPQSFKKLKVNDIVVFQRKNKLITHRIIFKNDKNCITKGDNKLISDGLIDPKQIIGKVYQIKRNKKIINLETQYLLQSTLYFQEIIKIKNAFEKAGVDFVFLKGLPLHLYFEKTHPKRIYADCDVLVAKKDFPKTEIIIKKFGYRKNDGKNKQVENNYIKFINGFAVIFDIHLEAAFLMTQFSGLEALYPQKLIDQLTVDLLNNKRPIKINGEKFFILNSKFLILYLALHLFHHNFRGAFRYQFLDKVIRSSHLKNKDWQCIDKKITEYRLGNFVYPVFILLKKYFKTSIPYFVRVGRDRPLHLNIFNDQPRLQAGINRFKNIFSLSPSPWWKKIFIFISPSVIYFIFWSLKKKLSSFFLKDR